jgi:hypothetical protein
MAAHYRKTYLNEIYYTFEHETMIEAQRRTVDVDVIRTYRYRMKALTST